MGFIGFARFGIYRGILWGTTLLFVGPNLLAVDNLHEHSEARPQCTSFSETVSPEQRKIIVDLFSTRSHRAMHALWHVSRAVKTRREKAQIEEHYGKAWLVPANSKLCPLPERDWSAPTYNTYGEDFLFMHRMMVDLVRHELIKNNLPCIGSWEEIPAPRDAVWSLSGQGAGVKSNGAYLQLKAWERTLKSKPFLSARSLSRVGTLIELTIHNNMHMRWATDRPAREFFGAPARLPLNAVFPTSWPFDAPAYDWLADPYAAAVNPIFWKLHGLVDDMIDSWLHANGKKRIALSCEVEGHDDPDCYAWKGTWVGGPMPAMSAMATVKGQAEREEHSPVEEHRRGDFKLGALTPDVLRDLGVDPDAAIANPAAPRDGNNFVPEDIDGFVQRQACN